MFPSKIEQQNVKKKQLKRALWPVMKKKFPIHFLMNAFKQDFFIEKLYYILHELHMKENTTTFYLKQYRKYVSYNYEEGAQSNKKQISDLASR